MKKSCYNHIVPLEDGTVLAYNCLSGALAEIEPENTEAVSRLLESPQLARTSEDRELLENLIEGGYLIDDETDEVAELWAESRSRREQAGTLVLTIAPTLACNFKCDYCFIDRSSIRMKDHVQQALIDYVENRMNDIARLRISWFGGEPTLCFSTIEKVQAELNEMAAGHQVEIGPISMVSNGYLLDRDMARRMRSLGFSRVQITLDGPEKMHDSRRKLHNGKGTYNRILKNIEEIIDLLKVRVRINIDRNNVESAAEVVRILDRRNILPEVSVSFAQVYSSGETCASIRDRCFCESEFSGCLTDLYRLLMERGVYEVEYPTSFNAVFCGALTENCLAVSPTGHLFRCRDSLTLDSEKAVGDIFGTPPTAAQQNNLEKFRSWDPFELNECRECNILPICLGGCPVYGKKDPNGLKGACSPWKYNLEEMLKLKYRCETEKR
jgi:uncharacterized protein